MANVQNSRDYLHPQYRKDREALNAIMAGEASSFNLADLARL
ncbi:MAG: DUF3288 family protein, partial [Cyanobacteria bacterium J06607_13]